MKKTLLGLLVLLLSFNFNLGNAFANTSGNTDFSKEELKEQQILFEKILEETPSGVYVDEEDQILSTLATSNNYTAKSGDILYTPNTQCINNTDICKNISGHAGLVHPSTLHVIHIAGPGQKPKVIPMKEWFTKYPKTIVVRHNNSTIANNAANWANSQFGTGGPSSNKTYKVTVGALKDSFNLSTLYCSLIIWQAYYKSGATLLVGSPAMPDQFVSLASNNNMKTHMKIGY